MKQIRLGIKENKQHFMLLLLSNFFVGSIVGLERTILPELAETHFGDVYSVEVAMILAALLPIRAGINVYGRNIKSY